MSHNIIAGLDAGILEGTTPTWHGMPEYKLVGDKPITIDDVKALVDYEIRLVPLCLNNTDGTQLQMPLDKAICRVKPDGTLFPLGRAVGRRFTIIPRDEVLYQFDEHLLARFSDLKIAGAGTLGGGQTFFIQFRVENYNIKGDKSDHQLRLSYMDSYGKAARVFCTGVRIVCQNTLRYGMMDALANNMLASIRHTASAQATIEAKMELFAKIHLGLLDEIEQLENLTKMDVDGKYVDAFLDEMFPLPKEPEKHVVTVNRMNAARQKTVELFEHSSDTMDKGVDTSRYALLQAFTDVVDHHIYFRDPANRWTQSLDGVGSRMKDRALEYLSA